MEYSGLIQKYKIDRPLSDEERALQLKQNERLEVPFPHYHLAVTRLSSTYLETVDKYYEWKGFLTFWMLVVLLVLVFASVLFLSIPLTRAPSSKIDPVDDWLFVSIMLTLFIPLFWLSAWALLKDAFTYTHYPIRLNRKERKVYVFRLDGSVLIANWDNIFFTLGRGNRRYGMQNWDIRGHLLDSDGSTVKETFAFAMDWENADEVRQHWEYLRRYMEEGPQAVLEHTPVFLPIVDKYETYGFGFLRLVFNFPGLRSVWLLSPVFFLLSLGRFIAMRTSDIPVWPKRVEEACAIEPGDPFERDARNNPDNFWRST